MTTVHQPVGAITPAPDAPTHDLRRLLRADAALCLISGSVVAAAARPLADLLGVTSTAPILATAGVLAVVGLALVGLAAAPRVLLAPGSVLSATGDAVWALGFATVAVLAPLSGPGRALVLAQAAVVAGIGLAKRARIARLAGTAR
jgi:hypothetical protein